MGHFGLYWFVWVLLTQFEWHLDVNLGRPHAQVGRLMLAFSARGLDMRIWELLLLRIDS